MNWRKEASPECTGPEMGPVSCRIEGDALIMDCTACRYIPVPGSRECIGCMVRGLCDTGSAARIVLRTGKDTEVSGRSGAALREAASLKRWAMPSKRPKGRCAKCPVSRTALVEMAWETFPDPTIEAALAELDSAPAERPECEECLRNSRRALEQLGRRLDDLKDRMAVR